MKLSAAVTDGDGKMKRQRHRLEIRVDWSRYRATAACCQVTRSATAAGQHSSPSVTSATVRVSSQRNVVTILSNVTHAAGRPAGVAQRPA